MWIFSLEDVCDQWASTDEGNQGEADINCLYTGTETESGMSDIKIFLADSSR